MASKGEVIPFGKHKGKTVTEVKQVDPAYLQWLCQQAWFIEKFQPVYQIVINNYAPPPEETPAHNAMQVRFLDFDYRHALVRTLGLYEEGRPELIAGVKWKIKETEDSLSWQEKNLQRSRDNSASPKHIDRLERSVSDMRELFLNLTNPIVKSYISDPIFEAAVDVKFNYELELHGCNASKCLTIFIEIKPSMGDDFPAVLRQIMQQKKTVGYHHHDSRWVLLIDDYAAMGATLEQMKQVFASSHITVVLAGDVRDHYIGLKNKKADQP